MLRGQVGCRGAQEALDNGRIGGSALFASLHFRHPKGRFDWHSMWDRTSGLSAMPPRKERPGNRGGRCHGTCSPARQVETGPPMYLRGVGGRLSLLNLQRACWRVCMMAMQERRSPGGGERALFAWCRARPDGRCERNRRLRQECRGRHLPCTWAARSCVFNGNPLNARPRSMKR